MRIRVAGAVMLLLTVAASLLAPVPAGAAALTPISMTPSDPRAGAVGAFHTFVPDGATLTTIRCITVTYNTAANGSGSVPPGLDASATNMGGTYLSSWTGWGSADSTGETRFTSAAGATPAASSGVRIDVVNITNPSTAGTTYYALVRTWVDQACTTLVDSGVVAIVFTNGAAVTIGVLPTLTFSVAGYNSGSCNGATITESASTPTAVSLASPTVLANRVAGQTLTVSSNAASGYSLYLRTSGSLTDGTGHTIADVSSTNAAPAAFPSPGTPAFGYTTDHALSGSSTRFQSNKWAKVTTSNGQIAYQASGPTNNDATHVCFQFGIGPSTLAGRYGASVTYTAVPLF